MAEGVFLYARFVMSVLRDYVNYIEVMWVILATFLQSVICTHMIGSRRPAGYFGYRHIQKYKNREGSPNPDTMVNFRIT